MIELKPCPFCGADAELVDKTNYEFDEQIGKPEVWDIQCGTEYCYLQYGADWWEDLDIIIEKWNNRNE